MSKVLVVAISLFVVAYGWSWGPLGWLVPSELFPLEMRSAGQSVVVCVNLLPPWRRGIQIYCQVV